MTQTTPQLSPSPYKPTCADCGVDLDPRFVDALCADCECPDDCDCDICLDRQSLDDGDDR